MKVAVVGSRGFPDHEIAWSRLSALAAGADDLEFVSGGADGPDSWAEDVAHAYGVPIHVIRPRWQQNGHYNPRAGFERNEEIIREADWVIAFWDGKSRGTKNDIELALRYHKHLEVIFPEVDYERVVGPAKDV